MDNTLLWLRPADSPPPPLPARWHVMHCPITRIIDCSPEHYPFHASILFTSARAPALVARRTRIRAPLLCVGEQTLAKAMHWGWNKTIAKAQSVRQLQEVIRLEKPPFPLLYAHGMPLSMDPHRLLSPLSASYHAVCCYRQCPENSNWEKIDELLTTSQELAVPILSALSAHLWRAALKQKKNLAVRIIYYCLSTRVAHPLTPLRDNETLMIARHPTLPSLLDSLGALL